MDIKKINHNEVHNQVKYIQDTFEGNNIKINQQSFLFKLS